jgi:hypothetical protein
MLTIETETPSEVEDDIFKKYRSNGHLVCSARAKPEHLASMIYPLDAIEKHDCANPIMLITTLCLGEEGEIAFQKEVCKDIGVSFESVALALWRGEKRDDIVIHHVEAYGEMVPAVYWYAQNGNSVYPIHVNRWHMVPGYKVVDWFREPGRRLQANLAESS